MTWHPIETAPTDGTRILAWPCSHVDGEVVASVEWKNGWGWFVSPTDAYEFEPLDQRLTHWQPLPEPPE